MEQERIAYNHVAPAGIRAMLGLEQYIKQSGLDPGLLDLIRTRVSEINGCAYCIDMHTKDARARGESEQRLYELPAWRETPFYTDRERAALAWAEAVTLLPTNTIPDDLYHQTRQQFGEKELVDLTLAIIAINGWNRLAVPFRTVPGSYHAAKQPDEHAVHA
ncbi:MAG TPA: carboxymuconolactone decarboxylase family protein [Gemmatimonadaceae bacterium]